MNLGQSQSFVTTCLDRTDNNGNKSWKGVETFWGCKNIDEDVGLR